ncbi:hypothetical protein HJG60_010219 [Phyllostomus discolor]|uniref:Uncharacterized protein n=1 Tax=Phyllostomus discolor TaxID=89673 RepID=A0A834AYY8_9CHIR|nr:hypothetical protein HJG60_010219 [Phyllostomus discolor]
MPLLLRSALVENRVLSVSGGGGGGSPLEVNALLFTPLTTVPEIHTQAKRNPAEVPLPPAKQEQDCSFMARPVISDTVRNSIRLETHPLGILCLLICAPAPNAQDGKTIVISERPFLPPKSRGHVFMTSLPKIQTGTPGPLLLREHEEGLRGNSQAPGTFQEGTMGRHTCAALPDLLTSPQLDFGLNLFFQTKKQWWSHLFHAVLESQLNLGCRQNSFRLPDLWFCSIDSIRQPAAWPHVLLCDLGTTGCLPRPNTLLSAPVSWRGFTPG